MSVVRLDVFADYCQFYLTDPTCVVDLLDVWTPQATADRFIDLPTTAVFGTDRNYTVPVVLEMHRRRPSITSLISGVDHAVLFGIENRSGKFKVVGCTEPIESAFGFDVLRGLYSILYTARGLATVNNLDGDDCYYIHLWPTSARPTARVLRRHPPR